MRGMIAVGLASFVLAIASSRSAPGDEPCDRPAIQSVRYDEDYGFLRDPACRTELWDPIKYISLDDRWPAYLSLGADVRERVEYYRDQDWGRLPDDGYLLSRVLVHADLHLGPYVRAFVQLASAVVVGKAGEPGPTDQDLLDLHQAFADVSLDVPRLGRLTLRAGRQEIDFPDTRLISVRERSNVRLSFDGLRILQRVSGWQINLLALAPVVPQLGVFDDVPQLGQRLWGLYAFGPVIDEALAIDAFYLGYLNERASYEQGTARELRHSIGARFSGTPSHVDYNIELVYQLGSFGDGRIRAWTIASDTGYTFTSLPWQPRLGTQANATSGDKDLRDPDLETFNPLFPRGSYFSEAALIGPLNHIDLHPALEVYPTDELELELALDAFWRQRLSDGLYTMAGQVQVPGAGNPARFVGSELAATVTWRPDRHTKVVASYSHFFTGPFLRHAGLGRDVDFVTTWISYRL